jgi:hypothetical protein
MPFGYKNGPSIFQQVMQNVLTPFLWIFALVYINDIIIFSRSFEDHLGHLDQVLKAVAENGITFLSKSLKEEATDNDFGKKYTQYPVQNNGLIYFEDWNRNHRLVVPESLRVDIMSEVHNTITEAAHGGYAKTYNRIAAIYYWPRMSRDIKKYVSTCDICQKTKPRRHAPVGMLQPIPIPSQPFK